ncbi:MAG: peptidylprolyl isomerase, partial [Bacteroidota bacterium]
NMENNEMEQYGDQFRTFWLMQRDMIRKNRLQTKLQSLVSQAMYTPSWMAEAGYANQSQTTDINFVKITYDQIPNEEVTVSDSDLSSYMKANAARYERKEEQRILDYVVFDVIPTSADSAELRTAMADLKTGFATAENGDSTFVLTNDGIISPGYFSAEEAGLNGALKDTIMNIPVGSVYGPYVEDGEYRLVKVRAKATMADTADTRHILLRATTPADFATANERADSMMNVLRTGAAEFDSLAIKFSEDGSASQGGKIENVTPNQFVPEYNDLLFITGDIGTTYKIKTQFGVHVVEILRRSASTTERVQVAFVSEPIVPSQGTITEVFKRASQFAADQGTLADMRTAAQAANDLRVVSTPAFDKNAFSLGSLGFSQETKSAICWAFGASEGEVSPETYSFADTRRYYDNKYVVIGLKDVLPAGMPAVADVRDKLETEVLREKKAANVASRIQGKDLNAIASEFGSSVQAAAGVTFDQANVAGIGQEPKVAAAAAGLAQGQRSDVITGAAGLYIIEATNKPALGQATNIPQLRQNMSSTAETWVSRSFVSLLRSSADVEDNRSTFDCQ